jgi:hypothetical protein
MILGMKLQRAHGFAVAGLCSLLALAPCESRAEEPTSTEAELAEHGVIKRGAEIGNAPVVELSDVLKDASAFGGKRVIVEGPVGDVCQMKGCWMGLVPEDAAQGIRVTFKEYGFFVPRDSQGLMARMEGAFETNVLSKEDADHLEGEGARLTRNPDGTVTELSFVASGVELRRSKSSS